MAVWLYGDNKLSLELKLKWVLAKGVAIHHLTQDKQFVSLGQLGAKHLTVDAGCLCVH